jgi:hypothetical protein
MGWLALVFLLGDKNWRPCREVMSFGPPTPVCYRYP